MRGGPASTWAFPITCSTRERPFDGTWSTTWSAGRFVSKKLIKKGAYTIQATDADYNPITMAPVNFYEKPKKDDKK